MAGSSKTVGSDPIPDRQQLSDRAVSTLGVRFPWPL